jgi:microcystin degradation protein MlrC
MAPPRVALLGFSIECNKFAPPATLRDFRDRTFLAGEAILSDARSAAPLSLGEMPGFVAAMDAAGPWEAVPILLAVAEPGGPVAQPDFESMMTIWRRGLADAGKLDGVYCMMHGAGLAEDDEDPDGTVLAAVRAIVGPDVPIVASFDLHANVSQRMVDAVDVFVGYLTNPHLDMRERGAECATHLRALMAGLRTTRSFIRLPIVAPTVTMLTAADAPQRPYAEMIDWGQRRMREADCAGTILNVSVIGGFPYSDTSTNGIAVVVTGRADAAMKTKALTREIAELGWRNRERFRALLTDLETATQRALAVARDPTQRALCFADVADNPGGGARGNTMAILEAFHRAGVRGALVGIINDAPLAAEAHRLGEDAHFTAQFNRAEASEFSKPFAAGARVLKLSDGRCVGRRGIFRGTRLDLGASAALEIGGIVVIVISQRTQCADPIFFEMFGLDIAKARVVVVKSRGHFRGGFDEFFDHRTIIEVDGPGLTSPILSRFPWARLPRPVIPLDDGVTWSPPP